jgi:hypothetical protein
MGLPTSGCMHTGMHAWVKRDHAVAEGHVVCLRVCVRVCVEVDGGGGGGGGIT